MLRLIDEVGEFVARIIFQRSKQRPQEALLLVVQACERLFSLEADKLFQFPPDQHYAMLIDHEPPGIAVQKVQLYAALNSEAGKIYTTLGHPAMARGSFINALRLTLKIQTDFPHEHRPAYAPSVPDLLDALKDAPLDAETAALVRGRAE
jgi:hypothetical protein